MDTRRVLLQAIGVCIKANIFNAPDIVLSSLHTLMPLILQICYRLHYTPLENLKHQSIVKLSGGGEFQISHYNCKTCGLLLSFRFTSVK